MMHLFLVSSYVKTQQQGRSSCGVCLVAALDAVSASSLAESFTREKMIPNSPFSNGLRDYHHQLGTIKCQVKGGPVGIALEGTTPGIVATIG